MLIQKIAQLMTYGLHYTAQRANHWNYSPARRVPWSSELSKPR
jgi:hypothetical protein